MSFHFIAALLVSFLSGSLPTALLMGKMKGVDLRKVGSGNIGATNAFRSLGKGWGIACLIIDAFKGWAPAFFFRGEPWIPSPLSQPTWMLIVGLAAIAGHTFSPWVKFKGGKGVATSLGVFLAVAPIAVLVCFAICATIIGVSGYVSLGSITGATLLPILIIIFSPAGGKPWTVIGLTIVLCSFVIWKHRENIKRLRAGNENWIFGEKKAEGN